MTCDIVGKSDQSDADCCGIRYENVKRSLHSRATALIRPV